MTDVAALIADMVRAGVDPELIGRTAAALSQREAVLVPDEAADRRRAKDRERKRLRNSAEVSGNRGTVPSASEVFPQTPFPNSTNPGPQSPLKGPPFPSEFERWYSGYPHKVQRGAAERAFPKARKLASLETLTAGVERYVASKPPDRPYQNPATWLNGKGWLDEPVTPQARAGPTGRPNPGLDAANALMEKLDAVSPSETQGNQAYPRLVAFTGSG